MKRIFRLLRIFLLGLLVATMISCQTTSSVTPVQKGKHVAGSSGIGLIQWESIPAAESKISIVDEGDAVLARREKKEEHRSLLSQAFQFKDGSLLYEKRKNISPETEVFNPSREIMNRYGAHPELLSLGLTVHEDQIVGAPDLKGDFAYTVAESAKKTCVVFFGYSPDSVVTAGKNEPVRHYQAVTGTICTATGTEEAGMIAKETVALLNRVLFDDGEYTRKQLLAKAFRKLDKIEEQRMLEMERDQSGPEIHVAGTVEAAGGKAVVSGRITDDSVIDLVRIEGDWVELAEDGSFTATVKVDPSVTALNLLALDQYGNSSGKKINIVRKEEVVPKVVAPEERGTYYALLIGNSEYQHWRDLDTPRYDVESVSRTLQDGYNFNIRKVMVDSSHEDILKSLNDLRDQVAPGDSLLVYYSGHGVLHKGKGYWVPADGYLDDPAKWIPNVDINRALRRIPARHVIVVADSCYSGTLAQEKFILHEQKDISLRSRTAMSAGSGDEVVLEPVLAEGEKDNSVFAKKFIQVLEGNHDSMKGGNEIFQQVKSLLKLYPQHPQYGALTEVGHEEGGDFYFVRK
ncbi:MAG: caspase family protein [Pseudomonadota bacterium]